MVYRANPRGRGAASKIAGRNVEDKRRMQGARGAQRVTVQYARARYAIYIRGHGCTAKLTILPFSTARRWPPRRPGRRAESNRPRYTDRQYGSRKLKASCFACETELGHCPLGGRGDAGEAWRTTGEWSCFKPAAFFTPFTTESVRQAETCGTSEMIYFVPRASTRSHTGNLKMFQPTNRSFCRGY